MLHPAIPPLRRRGLGGGPQSRQKLPNRLQDVIGLPDNLLIREPHHSNASAGKEPVPPGIVIQILVSIAIDFYRQSSRMAVEVSDIWSHYLLTTKVETGHLIGAQAPPEYTLDGRHVLAEMIRELDSVFTDVLSPYYIARLLFTHLSDLSPDPSPAKGGELWTLACLTDSH